ncbi:MAG: division/cell wall cluster transcriptional repressor MraZ [Bacteroidota bacterium]
MANFIGEYECTMDAKFRMMIPGALYKQFAPEFRERFIISRSIFQKCLVLFPLDAWEENLKKIGKLSEFNKKADDFIRVYLNGATEVELDGTKRILLPKKLCEYASITKDIVITARLNKVEIWSAPLHAEVINKIDHQTFENLAEELLGNIE